MSTPTPTPTDRQREDARKACRVREWDRHTDTMVHRDSCEGCETVASALAAAEARGREEEREEIAKLAIDCWDEVDYPGVPRCQHKIAEDCLDCFAAAIRARATAGTTEPRSEPAPPCALCSRRREEHVETAGIEFPMIVCPGYVPPAEAGKERP